MSAAVETSDDPRDLSSMMRVNDVGRVVIISDTPRPSCATIPRDKEKEKIKRLLYSLIDRIEKL